MVPGRDYVNNSEHTIQTELGCGEYVNYDVRHQ